MSTTAEIADRSNLAPDDLFQRLVHLINTTDIEIGVTLHVNGVVVTGKLVSGTTYWASSADYLRENTTGDPGLVEAMAKSMERVARDYDETRGEDTESDTMAQFVHMRDARSVTPKGGIPRDGTFWRGRLASVDGFTLGELGPPASLEP
jgi:hypothetical protein